ncbi:MAG: hypothetical protein IPG76_15435 [Acidobacteria bacterium]|nr:hypothetical protein [Acidobacteriota bacterium]
MSEVTRTLIFRVRVCSEDPLQHDHHQQGRGGSDTTDPNPANNVGVSGTWFRLSPI